MLIIEIALGITLGYGLIALMRKMRKFCQRHRADFDEFLVLVLIVSAVCYAESYLPSDRAIRWWLSTLTVRQVGATLLDFWWVLLLVVCAFLPDGRFTKQPKAASHE